MTAANRHLASKDYTALMRAPACPLALSRCLHQAPCCGSESSLDPFISSRQRTGLVLPHPLPRQLQEYLRENGTKQG